MHRLLLAATAALCLAAPAWAQQKITLRAADHYPVNASTPGYTIKHFMDEVKQATAGAVDFEYYPAEQLGKARDLLALTQQGVTDIGMVAPPYVSDRLPLSGVVELPGMYANTCQGGLAFWKLIRHGVLKDREYAPAGIHPLLAFVLPPYQVLSRAPINSLADLKGLKLRSAGGGMDLMVRKLDATPVHIGGADVYSALSRGTIDGLVFPLQPVLEFKLQSYLKAGTLGENFGGFPVTYAMSEKRWAELPANVQQALDQAGEETTSYACKMLDHDNDPAVDALRKAGLVMQNLPPADHASLHEMLQPVQADWAAGMDKRGMPGTQVLQEFTAALANP